MAAGRRTKSNRRSRAGAPAPTPVRQRTPLRAVRRAQREAENAAMDQRIADRADGSLRLHAAEPERIERRLRELDKEWSIERFLQTNGSAVALAGAVLGMMSGRRWLLLSALASGCLLQYAARGWCPPVRTLRGLGIRTDREIERERYGLKALRGDFESLPHGKNGAAKDNTKLITAIMTAVRR